MQSDIDEINKIKKVIDEQRTRIEHESNIKAIRSAQKLDTELNEESGVPLGWSNISDGISEFEEGAPRSEFGTRDEYKKMRARTWGDMQRRRNE